MIAFTFDNPTARPAFAALRVLLGCLLSPRYRNGFALTLDPIEARARRTRRAVDVELYEDGSGLELACFGWWLLVGVEPKRALWRCPRPDEKHRAWPRVRHWVGWCVAALRSESDCFVTCTRCTPKGAQSGVQGGLSSGPLRRPLQ